MWLRRPHLRHFALSLGGLVGLAGFLATPPPWPTHPILGLGVGACVTALVWTLLEQRPDALDRAVEARVYHTFSGLGVLLVAAVLGPRILGGPVLDEGTAFRVLVFALATGVVAGIGNGHRGTLLREREPVRAEISCVESTLHAIALAIVGTVVFVGIFSLGMGRPVSPWVVGGGAIGGTIGSVFTEKQEYDLVALDDHLLVQHESVGVTSVIPWSRVWSVTVEGDTLRVVRGLPQPAVYTADLSAVEDRRAVLDAFGVAPYYR